MIQLLVADDHDVVRAGLKQIVADDKDLMIAAEASSGQEVLDQIAKKEFDAVVLDINMPGRDGIDVLRQIKAQKPKLPVLILSVYPEEQYARRVLKAGASGYLNKNSSSDELVAAIRRVCQGRKYISPSVAEKLAEDLEEDTEGPIHEKLSDREYQVLSMIAKGKTVSEIANELALSAKTISTYRTRILEKMNIKTNSELTHYAFKHGIVD